MTFEQFFSELTSDSLWFDGVKVKHSGKDIRGTANEIYLNYLAEGSFPDIKESRKYLNNKLIWKPKTQGDVYMKPQEKETDFNLNPLNDEQLMTVHQLLEKAKQEIQSKSIQTVPKLSRKEIEEEGQERPKAKPPHPKTPQSVVDRHNLHIQYLRENYDPYTGDKLPGWVEESEWLQGRYT